MGARTQEQGRQEQGRLLSDIGLPERYRVLRRIARGGMASVWCAEDLVLGRRVAIKLLSEQFLYDPSAVHRFEREARAAARLSGHANVVTIFDVGQTEPRADEETGRPFIVMECLAGGTVADALRVGEVSREDALAWIQQAAEALDYAHRRGVVHRDIKPANLLLDGRRVLHVADFGIARVGTEDTITAAGELFGTAAYFSPEQAMGRPATAASDRYALAVVAYELLVGERPFAAENFAAQARQQVEVQPPSASARNPELPQALDAILARGMAKSPAERWASAAAFAQAVKGAIESQPTRAFTPLVSQEPTLERPQTTASRPRAAAEPVPPRFAPHRVSGGAQRRPRAVAIAALAAVVVAVAVAAATGIGGSPTPVKSAATGPSARHHATPVAKKHPTKATTPASSTPATTSTSSALATPPAGANSAPASGSPLSLQARGHQLMLSGAYNSAVGLLRQAVAAGPSSGLTYAYALYDLGRSLRLAGDPRDAAVVLQRRLLIPNQTEVVRQELQLALRALGAQANSSGATSAQGAGSAPGGGSGQGGGSIYGNRAGAGAGHGQGGSGD